MKKKKIFVSMAAYRDPELIPTIDHCLGNALHPEDIRIGVAWQHAEEDPKPKRVDLLDIDYKDSKGACWARSKIQTDLYDGEEYFLQLDSHHRFVPAWDKRLLEMIDKCESDKPVLSSYVPGYDPDNFKPWDMSKKRHFGITTQRFTSGTVSSIPLLKPHPIPQDESSPLPAKFIAAGLLFAKREFVDEVPYDPHLYFAGEEIAMSLRAFTHGFDMFVPNGVIVAHEYTRKEKPKHWKDHSKKKLGNAWGKIDISSRERVRMLLTGSEEEIRDHIGKYGLGKARSRLEYEKMCGLLFNKRYAHPKASEYGYAIDLEDWDYEEPPKNSYEIKVDIEKKEVFQEPDVLFCRFVVMDDKKVALDVRNEDISSLQKYTRRDDLFSDSIVCERKPVFFAIWPYSKKKGWLTRIEKRIKVVR